MSINAWMAGKALLPTLYSKTATGAINTWRVWTEGEYVCMEWGQKDGAMQTSRYACTAKNAGRANATTAEEQSRAEAASHWKKKVKSKYHPEESAAVSSLNLKPMLAKGFKERAQRVTYPAWVQPKLDGLRCLTYQKGGVVLLQSRGGDPYSMPHIAEDIAPILQQYNATLDEQYNVTLDGELYIHGASLQTINSLVRRQQVDSVLVEYHVYDVIPGTGYGRSMQWNDRTRLLYEIFAQAHTNGLASPHIHLVPTWQVKDEQEVKAHHDHCVQKGYEGVMVRLSEGLYRFGFRSSELLKYKEFQDDEFQIVGFTAGKGKFQNAPIFRCVTPKGAIFDVVPRGTEEERSQMLADAPHLIGRMLTVRFFDWTDDGLPHFPVGMAVREPGA